jgi:nucleotide-binding universal stress UspA family protein
MKSILFPTDFSKNTGKSLQYAIQFSKEKKCKLIFFHAFYDTIIKKNNKEANDHDLKLEVDLISSKLRDELKKTYRSLKIPYSEKDIEVIAKFGKNLVELINQTVLEKQINLIIIGTHYATGLKSLVFENQTVKLISKSMVPVLAIPIGYKYKSIKKIVYSTDLLNTKKEINQLNEINKIFKSEISIIYFDSWIEKTKQELTNTKFIETTGIPFHFIRVDIGSHLITNLVNFIKNKKNSVMCLFHSPKNKILEILLGSNTNELVLHLKSPLLSINRNKK